MNATVNVIKIYSNILSRDFSKKKFHSQTKAFYSISNRNFVDQWTNGKNVRARNRLDLTGW